MNEISSAQSQLEYSSIASGVPCGYINGAHRGAKFFMLSSIKVFSKAIVALSRIGDVLCMEPSVDGLTLRCSHNGRSAYGEFQFSTKFFDEIDVSQLPSQVKSCRISMKNALLIFRSINAGERGVHGCEITIDPDLDTILVKMYLSSEVTRSYELNMLDVTVNYRITVDRSSLVNRIETNPELLSNILTQSGDEVKELVLDVTREKAIVRTFNIEEDATKSTMEMEIMPSSFSRYKIRRKTQITFPIKEFTSLVTFGNDHALPLNLYFDKPGKALILFIGGNLPYTAEVKIATVEGDEDDNEEELEDEDIIEQDKTIAPYDGEDVGREEEEEEEEEEDDNDEDEPQEEEEEEGDEVTQGVINQQTLLNLSIQEENVNPCENDMEVEEIYNDINEEPIEKEKSQRNTQFRRFFLSSSQMTQHASQLYERERVIVNESDVEDNEEEGRIPFKRRKKTKKTI